MRYYLKRGKKEIDLEKTPIFTRCFGCGRELEVTLESLVHGESLDDFGTFCLVCGARAQGVMDRYALPGKLQQYYK